MHLLPAPVFRATARIQARRRLGLTATLIREDGAEPLVFTLVGPKCYDDAWRELEDAGWIAGAECAEVRVPFAGEDTRMQYALAEPRERFRIASTNPSKSPVVHALLDRHRGRQALVLATYVGQLKQLAAQLGAPIVTGQTPHAERSRLYDRFRAGELPVLCVSKVANFALDLPSAGVAIEVSGTYGSRQEEAQRLGRLLRPEARRQPRVVLHPRHARQRRAGRRAPPPALPRRAGLPLHRARRGGRRRRPPGRRVKAPPATLEPALAALSARHRRIVAETVGADGAQPAAIAAMLQDEARLAALVCGLSDEARAATTELAFAAVDLWSPPGAPPMSRTTFDELERRGLALCFESRWSLAYVAPLDLVPSLRRVRARAHAARIPDAPAPARSLAPAEQILHDAAAVGATIAHGGIQVKADGRLYAKALPKLAAALPPLPAPCMDIAEHRAELALALLRELGALRVACDDVPGRNARRELRLAADLVTLLDRPFEDRLRLPQALRCTFDDQALIDPLLDALTGRTVALATLGEALIGLFAEARKHLEIAASATPADIGLAATTMRWLCGGATIGLDADGYFATATVGAEPPPPVRDGPPCVAQADFELVALRPLLPHERAALLLLCEPVPGREHVVRLTRERIQSATRALRERDPGAILGRIRALAAVLPQNLERSVADWVRQAPARARLRSAIVVDLADPAVADGAAEALGSLVAERLAPHLLAVTADELATVATTLRKAQIELEPGMERLSGAWHEPPGAHDHLDQLWRASGHGERASVPSGRLVSGLDDVPAPPSGALEAAQQALDGMGIDLDLMKIPLDDELEPAEILMESYELGAPVELRYAGAGGTVVERVTVEELDDSRFLVEDADTGARRWRWLRAVLDAKLVAY